MKKDIKKDSKTIKLYEALFFGACILLFVFMIFRIDSRYKIKNFYNCYGSFSDIRNHFIICFFTENAK